MVLWKCNYNETKNNEKYDNNEKILDFYKI